MSKIRLGQVDWINCLPVYYALEEGLLPLDVDLVKGSPTTLDRLFLSNQLDAALLSSIEYARNADKCVIIPGLSICAYGRVKSNLLFSKVPVTELEGKKVCLSESSATGVALMKVLFDHYYDVNVEFETALPDLGSMMDRADGALLIGDAAMQAYEYVKEQQLAYHVTDLGEAWKQFSGAKMVYAVWVVRKAGLDPAAVDCLSKTLLKSKEIGFSRLSVVSARAQQRSGLPISVIEDYFHTIKYEFSEDCKKALLTFYDYAYKSGLIDERVKLSVWGEMARD